MRKFLFIAPLLGSLALSGCATTGANSPASVIEQIRQVSVSVCGFLPTVETVAAILAAGNPAVTGVSAIATAICAAVASVPPQAARRRGVAPPTVAGVVIHGRFVR